MQFSVQERLVLSGLLVGIKGSLETLRAVRKFKDDVVFFPEETEAIANRRTG